MHTFSAIAGIVVVVVILLDAFETVVLPRRVARHFRPSVWFYRNTWRPWARLASHVSSPARRESFLGYFGPLSLLALLGLWAGGLIFGFALLQFGTGEHLQLSGEPMTFSRLLYNSGQTFFTLGYGDITPVSPVARVLAVCEAGMGFAFLGTVIGYLPTIYSAFSRREVEISRLDARAGSPPTAAELLARFGSSQPQLALDQILRDWEHWAAEVLESHLSYPVLMFYRSQHNNQSWLGALTAILDTTALIVARVDGIAPEQAKITFAIARHAVVDLAQVVGAKYDPQGTNRLSDEDLERLRQALAKRGLKLQETPETREKLAYLRSLYEPYVASIARRLFITLPPWIHSEKMKDNWQGGPWDRLIQARGLGERPQQTDEHF